MEKINILGVHFNNVDLTEAVDFTMEKIEQNDKIYVVTPNAEITHLCTQDVKVKNIVNSADLILADGIGVVLAGKILKTPLKGKVAGIEFAEHLVAKMAQEGHRLFILGGKPGIAQKACENLQQKYLGLEIAGYHDGYFKQDDDVIEYINHSGANVLFVCLGAPRQEIFMNQYFKDLEVNVLCGVGGSADVFAGEVQRAPKIFIKFGLEWLYRLLKQPKRILRMQRLPLFLFQVFKYKANNQA